MKSYDVTSKRDFALANSTFIDDEFIPIVDLHETLPTPLPVMMQAIVFNSVDIEVNSAPEIDASAGQTTPIDPPPTYNPVIPEENPEIPDHPIVIVEEYPPFPGGDEARLAFLREHVKYPSLAREIGIQGIVYVSFVVEKDGSITNVKIARGIGGGCDEEAVRGMKMMPKWNPGLQRKNPVRVSYNMPIKFTLVD